MYCIQATSISDNIYFDKAYHYKASSMINVTTLEVKHNSQRLLCRLGQSEGVLDVTG